VIPEIVMMNKSILNGMHYAFEFRVLFQSSPMNSEILTNSSCLRRASPTSPYFSLMIIGLD